MLQCAIHYHVFRRAAYVTSACLVECEVCQWILQRKERLGKNGQALQNRQPLKFLSEFQGNWVEIEFLQYKTKNIR